MPSAERTSGSGTEAEKKLRKQVKPAAEIFKKYGDLIFTIIWFNVGDKSKADDIFQDFFLSIVHKPIPPNIRDVRGYISRAVKNDVYDAARQKRTHRARIQKYAQYSGDGMVERDPQNTLIQTEEIQKIFKLIRKHLPRHEAQALIQRFSHGRDASDAAERMHVNKRTFSRYLCTGLKKIRQIIQESKADAGSLP